MAGAAGIVAASGSVHKLFSATPRTAASTAPFNKWRGRVVINFNKTAAPSGDVLPDSTQMATIKTMVDDAIKLLTGESTVGAAWKAVFPASLSLSSLIAIKIPVGINSGHTAPHYSTVQGITEGLQQMDFGGTRFPAGNITIFDATGSNPLSTTGYTAANFPGITLVKPTTFTAYTDAAQDNANPGVRMPYCAPLNTANFLINVFSPRGHSTYAENFTLAFKNHYGTYNAGSLPHAGPATSQILRNINCMGAVYNKTVLLMCSGIYANYESHGPSGYPPEDFNRYSRFMDATSTNTNPTTIMLSTDPVSIEMQAIKMMRIQGQGQYAVANMPNYLKASGGVVVTGTNWPPNPAVPNTMDNIGIIDETQMDIRRIINGVPVVAVKDRPLAQARSAGPFVTASQVRGHNSTFIEFALPESHAGGTATIEIFDLKGKRIAHLSHRVGGVLNHLSWNETDATGRHAGRGVYIVHLVSGAINISSRFSIV
jgi:hypothetical protein